MTNIPHAHVFFDPVYQATFEHIVTMDNLVRAKAAADKSTLKFIESLKTPKPECDTAQANVTATVYESVREYSARHGMGLTAYSELHLNQGACRESARQQKDVGGAGSTLTFHESVLDQLFKPVLESAGV